MIIGGEAVALRPEDVFMTDLQLSLIDTIEKIIDTKLKQRDFKLTDNNKCMIELGPAGQNQPSEVIKEIVYRFRRAGWFHCRLEDGKFILVK